MAVVIPKRAVSAAVFAVLVLTASACSDAGGADPGSGGTAGQNRSGDSSVAPDMKALYVGSEANPPADSPPAATGKSVYWISCGQSVPDCQIKTDAAKAAATALGWDFHVADGNLGIDNGYVNAMRDALAAGPDAIVQDAIPCTATRGPLEEAKAAGIKVMGAETLDCDASGGPKLFNVDLVYNKAQPTGQDFWKAVGTYAADYIIDKSGGNAKIIANVGTGDDQFDLMANAFTGELAKCSGCEIVDTVDFTVTDMTPNGPWINAFRASLTRHPEATAVWMPFDFMPASLGGAQAMREAGSNAVGFGGLGGTDVLDLVRGGQWAASTASYDLQWVGWAAMDELNRAFSEAPAVPEGLGFVVVDKDHSLPAESGRGYRSSIDFQSAYKRAWGVD